MADSPSSSDRALERWILTAAIACIVIVLAPVAYLVREGTAQAGELSPVSAGPAFVGRETCRSCHVEATERWTDSDHDHAMAPASEETVLGDFADSSFEYGDVTSSFFRRDGRFFVNTEGPDSTLEDFEILYTFGVEPLQQYLIAFPGGRLQALSTAWDVDEREWFFLYPGQDIPPDDWLHWTRGGQNWNGMCAECHSTNLRKGYDPETKTYETTWSEIDVSCEACHGPGSRHVAWAEIEPMARPEIVDYGLTVATSRITSRQQVELCAPCHSRRSEVGDYDHTSVDLLENLRPALLREGLYHADGQILDEVYVYGSFIQSKMYKNDVRCSDCHDVHSLKLLHEGNALCLQCHEENVYDSYDHHFHKKTVEGQPSDGALCVKCHMPEQPYMVIDERADHSLRVPRPDMSLEIGTPNACSQSGCHDDKPLQWSADAYRDWYGKARKSHYGTVFAAGREGRPEARDELIRLAGDALHTPIVRATALSLLQGYPGAESTAAFNRALADDEALLRLTATETTETADQAQLVELLSPLLFDPVKMIRGEAASRLAGTSPDLLKPYQREALEEGLAEFEAAMEYSLDLPHAGHNLGNLYMRLGEPERAAAFYRTAVEIDDLFYMAKANLARILNSQGQNDEAEQLFREVLEDYPDLHDIAYSLGLLMAEMNRLPEAITYLEQAATGMSERSRIHYNLGLARQAVGDLTGAEVALRQASDLEPGNLDYLYALADHYLKRRQPFAAQTEVERMLDLQPGLPVALEMKQLIEQILAQQPL
jgi:tetratricopeptide (TPR) repeat protein